MPRAEKAERQSDSDTLRYHQTVSQRAWDRFFAQKAAAEAEAGEATEVFKLADPVSENSLLNKPAPPLAVTAWYSEKPGPPADKLVLLFFWNSRSEPCRRVIPDLNHWQQQFPSDLTVIGVTTETEAQVRQMTAPQIQFCHGGDSNSNLVSAAGITSVPAVLLIDRDGIVRYQGHPAAITEAVLERFTGKRPAESASAQPALMTKSPAAAAPQSR